MRIIKEYCPESNKYVIRTNTYANTFEHFNNLVKEAKNDFLDLLDSDIEIVKYAGMHYARTFGIEFKANGEKSNDYTIINKLEYTY